MATISFVTLSLALQTTPQVPSPILLILWNFSSSGSICIQRILYYTIISYALVFNFSSYFKQQYQGIILMSGKTFEGRSKINDLEELKKYFEKQKHDHSDFTHLLAFCFDQKRQKFIKLVQTIIPFTNDLANIKLKQNPILLDLCQMGTAEEVQNFINCIDIRKCDRRRQCLTFALKNNQRKNDRIQFLEISKVLYAADPTLITQSDPKILADALQKQQFQTALYLIQKGIQTSYECSERKNLLHLLIKNCSKKYKDIIANIKQKLVKKGVDEQKLDVYSRKPKDYYPTQLKMIFEEHKSHTNDHRNKEVHNRGKGRSEEGSQVGRDRNNQYREKSQISPLLKIDSHEQVSKLADNCIQKRMKQKSKQLADRQKSRLTEKSKQKQRERKQKINKRVFTPDEMKHFLNEDIKYFMDMIERENDYQKLFLNDLINKITTEIKQKIGATVKIFGSFATGLSLLESDIDMVIIPQSQKQLQSSFALLESIWHLLETLTEEVQTVKFIKTASVPIIKIQCTKKYDSKKIDITYKDQNHNGLISVQLIQKYLQIYPQLRPLVFVLKKFIYSTNIYDPYSGGLSSYGLILMIVAYLQNENRQRKAKAISQSNKQTSTAELLIGFLYFYGFKSNYINKQICIIEPERAKAEMEEPTLQPFDQQPIYMDATDIQFMTYPNQWQPRAKLMIVDPLNPKNNIGRATHKIRQIKTAFEMAYVCIHTNKNCKNKKSCQSYQRINALNLKGTKCENYKRPCCIISRMLNSTKLLTAA